MDTEVDRMTFRRVSRSGHHPDAVNLEQVAS